MRLGCDRWDRVEQEGRGRSDTRRGETRCRGVQATCSLRLREAEERVGRGEGVLPPSLLLQRALQGASGKTPNLVSAYRFLWPSGEHHVVLFEAELGEDLGQRSSSPGG